MSQIRSVDYIYDTHNNIKEAIVTYIDGAKKIAKTQYELIEIQQLLSAQNRQILIETPPSGKPI